MDNRLAHRIADEIILLHYKPPDYRLFDGKMLWWDGRCGGVADSFGCFSFNISLKSPGTHDGKIRLGVLTLSDHLVRFTVEPFYYYNRQVGAPDVAPSTAYFPTVKTTLADPNMLERLRDAIIERAEYERRVL